MNVQTWTTLVRLPMARLSALLLCLLLPLPSAWAQNNYGFSFAIGGNVNGAQGIATDAADNIYVADTNNNRIVKFDANLNFLGKISGTSSNNSQFSNPTGVAVDGSGNICVADYSNNRVEKFDTNGKFLWASGGFGAGNGQFQLPYGVAVDIAGNVYVADSGNNRIQIINASGNYVWQFNGAPGNQLSNPLGVAVDSSGDIYVVDNGNNAVKKFDSTGKWIWTVGGFHSPRSVAVDSAGNVDVSDTNAGTILRYGSNGSYLGSFTTPYVNGLGHLPTYGIVVDSMGNIFVEAATFSLIFKYDSQGDLLAGFGNSGPGGVQELSYPYGVAVDGVGHIDIDDTGNHRIVQCDDTGSYVLQFPTPYLNGYGRIFSYGIAIDSIDDIYISDVQDRAIVKYDSLGNLISSFGGGAGGFSNPTGVAIDSSGNIYVADTNNNRIQKLDPTGKFLWVHGSQGDGDGQFQYPTGVAVDSSGNIYVADYSNNRIQKLDSNFKWLWTVGGTPGSKPGQFETPFGLAVDSNGNVYVADTGNNRIQKFDTYGHYLTEISPDAWGDAYASSVSSVALHTDPTSNVVYVYATDITNSRVVVFEDVAVPTLTSLSQYQATVGSPSITLTVNGTNFGSDSVVNFGSNKLKTYFVSTTQLNATILASQLTSVKTFQVTVTNPGGGGTSNPLNFSIVNPAPTLTSITPDQAAVGNGNTQITLKGTGFVSNSTVLFGSTTLTSKYVSAIKLTATIPAAQLTTAGVVNVSVTNPLPAGGVSDTLAFVVGTNPVPSVSSLSPNQAVAGSAATTLTVNGQNFVNGATILFNGTPLIPTTFVSDTQLTATISTSQLATAGEFSVSVNNPKPGGGNSDSLTFTVANPTPVLTNVSPAQVTVGSGATTITLTGSGFTAGSTAQFNGASLTTTYVSATQQLTALIPAGQLTVPGNYYITVTNPAPGGGTSASFTFSVLNGVPTLSSLSPNQAAKGSKVTLTITGTNFVPGAKVSFGVSQLTNVNVSPDGTMLTATITSAQTKKTGAFTVIVTNPGPGGGDSNSLTFTVQ